MPLDKIVLILFCAVGAILAVVYGLALLFGAVQLGVFGLVILIPVAIIGYICARVLFERLNSKEDDYYDTIEK